jgi:GNAT superfamily N-acetyltransferase
VSVEDAADVKQLLGRLALARRPVHLAKAVEYRLFVRRRPLRLNSTRVALLEHALGGVRDYNRIICASAPGGRLLELEGVAAAVMPAVPDYELMNSVVYERADALRAVLGEVAATYDAAGVEAWMVYTPAVDGQARKVLKRAGHRLSASPTAMGRELRGLERPGDQALEQWTGTGDPATMAMLCDQAFGFGTAFRRTFARVLANGAHVYLASLHGEPVSCVLTSESDGNCAVHLLATTPEARGRGHSGALLAHALVDAAERGCATTTVISSRPARSAYSRLGYRAICPLQKWVRRYTADGVEV